MQYYINKENKEIEIKINIDMEELERKWKKWDIREIFQIIMEDYTKLKNLEIIKINDDYEKFERYENWFFVNQK